MAENDLSLFIVQRGPRVLGIRNRKLFLVCFLKEAMPAQPSCLLTHLSI